MTADERSLIDLIRLCRGQTKFTPEKTFQLLKEYTLVIPDDQEMLHLLNLGQNHEQKCDYKQVQEMELEIEKKRLEEDSESIQDYKEYQWQKRIETCRGVWKKSLEAEVNNLSELDKQRMLALKNSVIDNVWSDLRRIIRNLPASYNYRRHFDDCSTDQIVESMLPYFVQNLDHDVMQLLAGKDHKNLFRQEYSKLIEDVCHRVQSSTIRSSALYRLLETNNQYRLVDEDSFVRDWLESFAVCKVITRRESLGKFVTGGLYDALKKKYPKPGVGEIVRQCFNSNCGGKVPDTHPAQPYKTVSQ